MLSTLHDKIKEVMYRILKLILKLLSKIHKNVNVLTPYKIKIWSRSNSMEKINKKLSQYSLLNMAKVWEYFSKKQSENVEVWK